MKHAAAENMALLLCELFHPIEPKKEAKFKQWQFQLISEKRSRADDEAQDLHIDYFGLYDKQRDNQK